MEFPRGPIHAPTTQPEPWRRRLRVHGFAYVATINTNAWQKFF